MESKATWYVTWNVTGDPYEVYKDVDGIITFSREQGTVSAEPDDADAAEEGLRAYGASPTDRRMENHTVLPLSYRPLDDPYEELWGRS